jgi:hypothetical protein
VAVGAARQSQRIAARPMPDQLLRKFQSMRVVACTAISKWRITSFIFLYENFGKIFSAGEENLGLQQDVIP